MHKNEIFEADKKRYTHEGSSHAVRCMFWLRTEQCSKSVVKRHLATFFLKFYRLFFGLELGEGRNIGPGFYLGHVWNITINPKAVIGSNCNIHKGVVIGQCNRGERKGTPVIGNEVWIGANAVIVGHITIGDDVLIAPNAYVNCDIPSHSVVVGNPCIIKHRDNATENYICYKA